MKLFAMLDEFDVFPVTSLPLTLVLFAFQFRKVAHIFLSGDDLTSLGISCLRCSINLMLVPLL